MSNKDNTVYLILGGNLHDVRDTIEKAKNLINQNIGVIINESFQYQSEAWGFESEHPFINQVIEVKTTNSAQEVLDQILKIEISLGRIRDEHATGFSSRTIDIDILYYNSEVHNENNLIVPHYAIQDRLFTIIPLNDLIPNYIHPVLHKTNFELWQLCSDTNIPKRI